MCQCLHRARARKASLKNVASTPTFSLSFSVAVRIDTIKESVLGEMLGDAVRPAFCVQPIRDDLPVFT